MDSETAAERRKHVEVAYPRFIYAFSTCIVFVTSGPLAESADIQRRLISYARIGANGSKNQGFKPSLFLIFNRFRGGRQPDFDWSIKSSSDAFLASGDVAELKIFYSTINVVYIPEVTHDVRPRIALEQIDAFKKALRKEHKNAFQRRQDFHLAFTPSQLHPFLQKALKHFSDKPDLPFDWALEAPPITLNVDEWELTLIDLWTQYLRYHSATTDKFQIPYNRIRADFERHIMFCLRLRLCRKPPRGRTIVDALKIWSPQLQILDKYVPCGARHDDGRSCEKVLFRHGEYHECLTDPDPCSTLTRWAGAYQKGDYDIPGKFEESFRAALAEFNPKLAANVSLHNIRASPIQSITDSNTQHLNSVGSVQNNVYGNPIYRHMFRLSSRAAEYNIGVWARILPRLHTGAHGTRK
jgi:hypothetical protein